MVLASFLGSWWTLDAPATRVRRAAQVLPRKELEFHVQQQRQTFWCWAAVSASIAAYFDESSAWTQCSVAAASLGKPCCQDELSCNTTNSLEGPLRRTGNLAKAKAGRPGRQAVQDQIDVGRPIGCHLSRTDSIDHFVVIYGYDWGTDEVFVADPLTQDHGAMPWASFRAPDSSFGAWDATYFTQPAAP